jgi:preprotein translocase subunit YajC
VEALGTLLPFIAIAAIFWFLLIRPQRKRQLEMAATQRAASVGDEVMLGAGIVGRVATASDEFIELEITPGVLMKVARGAVVRVLEPDELADGTTELDEHDDLVDPTDPADPTRDH